MTASPAAPAQKDNLFGICAALGEDFGFDPLYLRIALGAGILWNPLAMLGGYLALGVLVLATRLLVPDPIPVTAVERIDTAEPAHAEEIEYARAA